MPTLGLSGVGGKRQEPTFDATANYFSHLCPILATDILHGA
jgi:hypothetical protein